jgi:hypothetical protein
MRRSLVFAFAVTLFSAASAQAQVGMPGIEYSNTVAGGDGVQLYPYDQQDPWIHGYFPALPGLRWVLQLPPLQLSARILTDPDRSRLGCRTRNALLSTVLEQVSNQLSRPESAFCRSLRCHTLHQLEAQPQPLIPRPGMSVYQASTVRPIGYESVVNQVTNPNALRLRIHARCMCFQIVSRQRLPASPHLKRSMLNSIQHGAFRLFVVSIFA